MGGEVDVLICGTFVEHVVPYLRVGLWLLWHISVFFDHSAEFVLV